MMKLRSWVESSNTLCLDLRSKIDFKACHLKSSTNIPLSQLSMRQSELPPKRLPFAVLEPLNAQGCSSWLTEHGWDIPWVFWEGSIQWKEISEWTSKDSTEQWLLFQPSPFLEKNIELIEESLPSDRDWQCLDIGCGSGRDIGWILSRSTPWKASAFDALQGAMVRTDLLVRNLNVSQHMNILAQAKLLNNGKWKLISNAWWNNKKENVELQDSMDEITKRLEMSELENRNQEELSFTEFYKSLSDNEIIERFDLILNIRFLSRPFLHLVPDMLNVGGSFVISHFVHDEIHEYSHPKRSLRLELNEISDFYKNMSHMEVIKDVIEESEDGRPINSIIVRRII